MKQYIFQLMVFAFFLVKPAKAQQPFQQLDSIKNQATKVYYSAGYGQRAAAIKKRADATTIRGPNLRVSAGSLTPSEKNALVIFGCMATMTPSA